MRKERELWNFLADRLRLGEDVMLLVVAQSTGSSPGRAGYKMAVGSDGALFGSIGGGVMEVDLVGHARTLLSETPRGPASQLSEQTHRKNAAHPSGMICSGEQTVILKRISLQCLNDVLQAGDKDARLTITADIFAIAPQAEQEVKITFTSGSDGDFLYQERLGFSYPLFIIGGGHCCLALSEIMSKMDFRIHIIDDRPHLNTIQKNEFADEVTIVATYGALGEAIPADETAFVVVMTLGYASDAVVIRQLAGRDFKYFGVLGSKAKMAKLLRELKAEGIAPDHLSRIRTPIGLPINSHTPEEIAVSIAAEIILVKNS